MADLATITLDEPITRGEQKIAFVQLRKPSAGELRGLSMVDLVKLEVSAVSDLLPRITLPTLTAGEIENLSPADLFALSSEVAGFLLPKAARESLPQ